MFLAINFKLNVENNFSKYVLDFLRVSNHGKWYPVKTMVKIVTKVTNHGNW